MSQPKHPIIVFALNLARNSNESVGPNTNFNTTGILHPVRHTEDQDAVPAALTQFNTLRSSFVPGFLAGENVVKNDDGTFTAYGQKAIYLKNLHTTGENPLLTVVSESYASA